MKLRALAAAFIAAFAMIPSAAHAEPTNATLYYQCLVGTVDRSINVAIGVATVENRDAVDTAAGICGLLISTGSFQAADMYVNWETNPNVVMVCGIPVGTGAQISVFATHDDASQAAALGACDYLTFNGEYHAYYYP